MIRALLAFALVALSATAQTDGRLLFRYIAPGQNASNYAHDASGRHGPATVSTGVVKVGGGYYFNAGTSNAIFDTAPILLSSQKTWTVIASFRATNQAASTTHTFFSEGCSTSITPYISIGIFNTQLFYSTRCEVSSAGIPIDINPTNRVVDGRWHRAAMVFVGSNTAGVGLSAYLDGVFVGASNRPTHAAIISNVNRRAVGALARTQILNPFRGDVEEVLGYAGALSADEIKADYTRWRATKP